MPMCVCMIVCRVALQFTTRGPISKIWSCSSYDSLLCYTSYSFLQTNTFQGILATDFVRSFAVFTYMCGDLSYSADTVIGFFSEDGLNATHPASDRWNAMAIACLNYPDNPWVNVVYELTAGKLKEIVWSLNIVSCCSRAVLCT